MSARNDEMMERIQRLRPIDDAFFQVLADDAAFCQEILRVILQDDKLAVESVSVQRDVKNLVGRSVRVDALCVLGNGDKANIEVQRSDNDNHIKRIRYNASCITASETEPGEKFENVPTVIMVYISENDFLGRGKTIYHIDNVLRETGEMIDNGLYTICVNTKVDDGSDVAELMKCFMQTEVENEKFPVFSNRMKYLKHLEGGSEAMSGVMEEILEEFLEERIDERIEKALRKGRTPEDIADILDIPIERVEEVEKKQVLSV